MKFVPNIFKNNYELFNYLVTEIDNLTLSLNKNIYFSKLNNNLGKEISSNSRNSRVVFDENLEEDEEENKIQDYLKQINKEFSSKTPRSNSYPLQYESLDFRFKLLEELKDKSFSIFSNLTEKQIYYLKKFCQGKANFKVLQCDKNIGSLIIENKAYIKLVNDHLNSNTDTYKTLEVDPISDTILLVNNKLSQLYQFNHISKKLFETLKANNSDKLGNLRLLPKLHKDKFSCRLIINCIKHPTSRLCQFVDLFLKPIVNNLNPIIKDSQDLLNRLDKLSLKNKTKLYLYSCDFESLYTNINPEDAINKIIKFIKDNKLIKTKHFDLKAFKSILHLIFKNNVFKFNERFLLQLIGLPMGCKCGPTVANLYLYIIEKSWIELNKPVLYVRFIDDIFLATVEQLNTVNFQKHFTYLKLNISHEKEVVFLDLKISFDYLTNKFVTNLYVKPTNTFCYLLSTSNHPQHIFKNIPKSLFIRIRRICSSFFDYLYNSRILIIQLCKRGYDFYKMSHIANSIGQQNRICFLEYKNRNTNNDFFKKISLFSLYDNSLKFLKKCINNAFYKIQNNVTQKDFIKNLKLNIVNSIGTNISTRLIHERKEKSFHLKTGSCNRCKLDSCNICNFVEETDFIKINNFLFPIQSKSTCTSKGIIYIIFCNLCNVYYIGESGRTAKERLSEHINKILNFKYNISKSLENFDNLTEVAIHFNTKNHAYNKHLSYFIIKNGLDDVRIRKSYENDLIHYFKSLNIKILNKKIPNIRYIKTLFFS